MDTFSKKMKKQILIFLHELIECDDLRNLSIPHVDCDTKHWIEIWCQVKNNSQNCWSLRYTIENLPFLKEKAIEALMRWIKETPVDGDLVDNYEWSGTNWYRKGLRKAEATM